MLILIPMVSFATWQVANTRHHSTYKSQYVAAEHGNTIYAKNYEDNYIFDIEQDNLKWNVFQNAQKYHWQVDWQVNQKYLVLNKNQIAGSTFCITLNRLLEHYPLTAQCNLLAKKVTITVTKIKQPPKHKKRAHKSYQKVFKISYSK